MPTVSFAADIVPLFDKTTDVPHMAARGVPLDDYTYMSDPANAQAVLDRLDGTTHPRMPPPPAPAWSPASITLFKQWMTGGYKP
jgi:hypothetical protein